MREALVQTLFNRSGPYMSRVVLGRLRIHVFHRPDADPDCHDHPADFWTFPLVSYVEAYVTPEGERQRVVRAFRLHRRRAEFAHRVLGAWTGESFGGEPFTLVEEGRQVATLVWWGRSRRAWGFHTAEGWVPWRTYVGD